MDIIKSLLSFIDKKYKFLIIFSLVLFFIFLGSILKVYKETGFFFYRDISLRGGKSIEVPVKNEIDIRYLISSLESKFDVDVKVTRNPVTGKVDYITIEGPEDLNTKDLISYLNELGLKVSEKEISVYSFSPKYGKSFYEQLIKIIIIATIITSIVIYLRVRVPVSTVAIIFSTIFDIVCTIGFLNLIGFEIADSGLAAILMIIGYAIDDNIIISTHFTRYKGKPFVERVYRASITALTLTMTTVSAIIVLYLLVKIKAVTQIAFILLISELFDELNTWLFNIPLYKWYSLREK